MYPLKVQQIDGHDTQVWLVIDIITLLLIVLTPHLMVGMIIKSVIVSILVCITV